MTINRRTVIAGLGAVAVAPAIPAIAMQPDPFNLTATEVSERITYSLRRWVNPHEVYGHSPAMDALPELRAYNALPQAERAHASARFIESQIAKGAEGYEIQVTAQPDTQTP